MHTKDLKVVAVMWILLWINENKIPHAIGIFV